ncbi:MAG: DUF5686 and carboxypeptidase regulatory-like domain-containing protein [Saprospiraceae bacterium]|nr:DUF5686 and carboxypeptidase regulatory-like domain-containing protein [Saprospiraceae bacterium]
MKKCYLLFFCLMGFYGQINSQITGLITDQKGEPLPFATVYEKGTSKGTTSNVEGRYELNLPKGKHEIVFQFVGYEQQVRNINYDGKRLELDVKLKEQAVELEEIVVQADAEDPAYPVIRQAMAKRKYYRDLVQAYSCDVYIKGNIKFLDAPESFMGVEIGDMGGSLDTNRQGIIYLSESKSTLHFMEPDKYKEQMEYTKVSGNDNGFGFNRASEMDFNLYESYALMGRQIISPIDDNAFGYYRYQLMGTFYDESGRLINQIKVIPKRSEDPVYSGIIYIVEDLWNIQGVDLVVTKGSMKQPGLDSLYIKQVHVPVKKPDVWRMISQNITFKAGLFGFQLQGSFTGIYSNYDLERDYEKGFFDNEIFKVEDKANDQPLTYFDSIRPIPLTQEEAVDYVRKDSLQTVRKSKVYLDSIDDKNNKFTVGKMFFGYSYNNSYERKFFSIESPLTTIQFNAVQGWNGDLGIRYRKEYDENNIKWFRFRGKLGYGLSDKRLRASVSMTKNFDRIHNTRLTVSGGIMASQFNAENPITPTLNTITSLWWKDNYMRLYDRSFGKVQFSRELVNGIYLRTSLAYEQRSRLENNSTYSFKRKDDEYEPNNFFLSISPDDERIPMFSNHEALIFEAHLRFRINQKYVSYPGRKFNQGSRWPDIWLHYRRGIEAVGSDVNFDHFAVQVRENYVPLGLIGYFEFNTEFGWFNNTDFMQFTDYKHFNGNQTLIGNPSRYMSSFMRLPYYDYSTNGMYTEAHFQHHFDGFLLDKIPLIRKLGFVSVLGASFLYTEDRDTYYEINFGIDRIGWGLFRFFRVDVVAAQRPNRDMAFDMMIGLNLPMN